MRKKERYQNKEAVSERNAAKADGPGPVKTGRKIKEKKNSSALIRAEAWKKQKDKEIIYLGEGVSVGLNNIDNNLAALQKHNLPVFNNENELANAIGIPLKELRFLSFNRRVSICFSLP